MKMTKTICGCGQEIYDANMVHPILTNNIINERFERPRPVSVDGILGFYWTEHRCDKWPTYITMFTDPTKNK
jgi:hypothetical protein